MAALRCLGVVVRKNFVLKARSWTSTLLELLLPCALMGLMIWIRTEITTEYIDPMSYVDSVQNNPTWFSSTARNPAELGPFGKQFEKVCVGTPTGLCPEIYSNATWGDRKEHYLGVALDGLLLLHMSLYNQQLGVVGERELADFIESLPGYKINASKGWKSYVRYFADDSEFQNYISDSGYGFSDDSPQLFGVIDVKSVATKSSDGTYSGDWDATIHLNATGPGSVDIQGATDVNTKFLPSTNPLSKSVSMSTPRIYWSGGLFLSEKMVPLATGGFVDLQTIFYAWVFNKTQAYTLPSPSDIPTCECMDSETKLATQDFRKCNTVQVLAQVLTPQWSTSTIYPAPFRGCLGRLSGLFPLSVREIPMPTPAYTKDNFATVVESVFGLFFTLLFLWPLTRIMNSLTEDKEMRINEVMKMMGLPAEAISVGWYITYGILWLLPSIIIPAMCSTTVFEHSDKFIVFLFFWLFGVCVITFCSLLSVFFERARTASVVGALCFFLLYFPYVFVTGPEKSMNAKTLASLCPPVALSFGASLIVQLESAGDGVQWGNLGEEINNFTMGRVFLMLVLDICLFAVLAWYLDKILVVGFGTRQPWYFFCSSRYWSPESSALSEQETQDLAAGFNEEAPANPRYEPVTGALASRRSVLLRGLEKRFQTQEGQWLAAVQGLTLNLYSGQMFCLLGHNGAGKTTTINMLSGMLPVSEGDAVMYGKSVKRDMASIRKFLGVCPQHDVIWQMLTVKEHLEFYAALKGINKTEVNREVAGMIVDIGLQEKVNSFAGTLSGGQKRRLSAGIALIGGSKVVFLDEPSSGVDPFSRRELWDCLKAKKADRTIIMTTHFMDEAEELGDRIAIMAAGQIKCVGSALFLKSQYGVGYTLTIAKRAEDADPGNAKIAELKAYVRRACREAELLSDVGVEVVYRMPMAQSSTFPELFEEFERTPERYGIQFFSVSVTTLEEVFLRVGQDHTEADQTAQSRLEDRSFSRQLSEGSLAGRTSNVAAAGAPPASNAGRIAVSAGAPPVSAAGRNQDAEEMRTPLNPASAGDLVKGSALFTYHLRALLSKRYHNAKRDKKAWCCQVGIPLVFLVVALATLKFTGVGEYPPTLLSMSTLPEPQQVAFAVGEHVDPQDVDQFMQGFASNVVKLQNASSDSAFDEKLLHDYYRSDGQHRYAAFRFQSVPKWAAQDADDISKVDGWTISSFKTPGKVTPTGGAEKTRWPNGLIVPVGTLWNEIDVMPLGTLNISVPLGQLNNRLQVDMFWNGSTRDGVPIYYHELHNQLLRTALGADTLKDSSVKVSNQPFPLTVAQKDLTDTQTSLFLALGFAFIPASYGAFVVMERENNSKHLQVISGVNFVSYWLATWLWDILNYLVPATLSILLILLFGIESLVSAENIVWTIIVVLLYGVSCTSFTYMLSFLFSSHTSAQNLLLVIYLFTGGILEIVSIVLAIIPSTKDLMKNVLVYLFRLLPNFCLADALSNLIIRKNPLLTTQLGCPVIEGCPPGKLEIVGWDVIYMGVGSLVWFAITLVLELAFATPRLRAAFQVSRIDVEDEQQPNDPDVQIETDRVQSGAADGEMIVLKGIRKVYPGRYGAPPKVAVENMHFGISEGQCFGYLGMNGAGKTTTMKILTGEDLCTSGEATLGGFNIKTQQNQVRQLMGYCPQFDALIGTLTAREHLMLFARIKGVPSSNIRSYVNQLLDDLTLTPYADRQAATFSGGTKRKLSLGIALVGNPRIMFLDEPTTGVDPESRRFLWTLISKSMLSRSVILTTHSMDECEALCSRIGIMVKGRLVCLGSAAHLKSVHGAGYQFDIAFKPGADLKVAAQQIASFVKQRFPDGVRITDGGNRSSAPAEAFRQRMKFRLPKDVMPISGLFREVEQHREELQLSEYSVSETTLDQIFINFAKEQSDEDTGLSLAAAIGSFQARSLRPSSFSVSA